MSPANALRRLGVTTDDATELVRIKGEPEQQLRKRKTEVVILQERLRSISNVLALMAVQPNGTGSRHMLGSVRMVVRGSWGHPIANIDIDPQSIRITPAASMGTRKAPFRSFLVHRVLDSMCAEDQQAVIQGKLSRENAIAFECREDRGTFVELVVHNYGTPQRLERVNDALNWTLEKQHAKRLHTT